MKCCPNCIGDIQLERHIFPDLSHTAGTCDYCGAISNFIIVPSELVDAFEKVTSAYIQDDQSDRNLVNWLQEDWLMFPQFDEAKGRMLLADILDDGDIVRKPFSPKKNDDGHKIHNWKQLCDELKHKNRFFPSTGIDREQLKELLSHLILNHDDLPEIWYRARINSGSELFTPPEMGAPPKEKTTNGRANPAGIPYLYLASDINTAMSEVRPHTAEIINIANFSLNTSQSFIDLRNPRQSVSPFMLEDENQISLLRNDIYFLEKLSEELKKPVLPHVAAIDYTPSQYLCEFIKKCGYAGVIYSSTVGDGMNLALFNIDTAVISEDIEKHKVQTVTVTSERISE